MNGSDHSGMTVAGVGDGNAGCEVQKLIAVRILHPNPAAGLGDKRIGTCQGRRKDRSVPLDNGAGFRTGEGRRTDSGSFHTALIDINLGFLELGFAHYLLLTRVNK